MQHSLVKFPVILGLAALLALPSLAISQPQADAGVQQIPGANRARAMAGEIRAAIGAGEITAEEGRARIARLRERMGQAPAAGPSAPSSQHDLPPVVQRLARDRFQTVFLGRK